MFPLRKLCACVWAATLTPEGLVFSFSLKSHSLAVSARPTPGTDEDAIISVLAYRNTAQRQEIRTAYKTTIGRVGCSLRLGWLTKDVSGNMEAEASF